ncbi:IS1634 family transposase [Helicovermis profundi]
MRLSTSKSKNATSLYVIKDITIKNKRTTKIVEKLGTEAQLREKLNGQDPYEWAKKYISELNKKEKENKVEIIAKFSETKQIPMDSKVHFNGGYLFLQDIYYDLGLHKISKQISDKYKFSFDLNSILSRLIYTRMLNPSSKLSSFKASNDFIEQPNFELQHIYRALEIISKESDFIESTVYKNSLKLSKRNTKVLYYDCTNYFFETEKADGLKQYGLSKEHRPNPIVQMGLFMDGDGIPLAFSIFDGNKNEQPSLKPLEKRILSDFDLSKFVVCTDAGLASNTNRIFNNKNDRAFIVTQSLKKLKKHLKDWALAPNGWHLSNETKNINLENIDHSSNNKAIYYKERWINENELPQKLIVTYSPKYRAYQEYIRSTQIQRAEKLVKKPSSINKKKQNDPKRFIDSIHCTNEGEIAEKQVLTINRDTISDEEKYDGFYGVCTNLDDNAETIIKVNKRRWEIEESFRILKTEFKARPVYLSRDDRIKAHFTTCFLSLLIYRLLEKKLDEKYTTKELIETLKNHNFMELKGEGYIPTYTRTDITDELHDKFGFRTDTQIISNAKMKKILKQLNCIMKLN